MENCLQKTQASQTFVEMAHVASFDEQKFLPVICVFLLRNDLVGW